MEAAAASFGLFGAPLDSPNRGVRALGRATVAGLARTSPGCHVTVFDDGWGVRPGAADRLGDVQLELCGVRTSRRWHRRESWTNIKLSQRLGGLGSPTANRLQALDAVLDVSGGDSFSDIYGMFRFRQVMDPKEATLRSGTPLLLLPQTFGPFNDPAARRDAADVVRRAHGVYSRDEASHAVLLDLLGDAYDPSRHREGVDMAFAMVPADPGPRISGELRALLSAGDRPSPVVGLNVSGLLLGDATSGERFGLAMDYRQAVVSLSRQLLADGAVIVLVPHVSMTQDVAFENDRVASERLRDELGEAAQGRVFVCPGELDADEMKWVVSRVDWFCGTRMHATIAGLSTGVPTTAIAYSAKTRGVFATCQVADQVVDARTESAPSAVDTLLASWRSRQALAERLRQTVPAVVARSRQQVEDIVSLVDAGGGVGARRRAPRVARRVETITDVAEGHLCSGCGTCASVQPDDIRMVDTVAHGRRPLVLVSVNGREPSTAAAVAACPGVNLEHGAYPAGHMEELGSTWGPVLELWEGWASDDEVRYAGSSGGVGTALAVHGLTSGALHGVLHTAAREDVPYLNRTVLSTSAAEVAAAAGSRYAPASPGDGLGAIETAPGPCAFVGKPCDVAGAVRVAGQRPELAARLGLTIAVFCAGTPTTAGTLEVIERAGMQPERVSAVRYRGNGWPGEFAVTDIDGRTRTMTYAESWGQVLQRHRQWRCMICPDHTGEWADVAVGDPWYRPVAPGEAGRSLVVVRTERGRRAVRAAMADGALVLERVPADVLPRSQPNLLHTRGAVWGRVNAMRLLGMAAPRYRRVPTLGVWWRDLTPPQKARSTLGTARRIVTRRLNRRVPVVEWAPSGPLSGPGETAVPAEAPVSTPR